MVILEQKDTEKQPQKTRNLSRTCLVRVSLTYDCSCDAKRLRSSFNSAANDTTLRLKLCFFSFKSCNNGSISRTLVDVVVNDEDRFSEIDIET